MECPKCNHHQSLSEAMGPCSGCGRYNWEVAHSTEGVRMVSCKNCEKGRTSVICKSCGNGISGKWLGKDEGEKTNEVIAWIWIIMCVFFCLIALIAAAG